MLQNFNQRKFSLVEMLIVIAIAVILLSLLIPSLRKVREHGLTINCTKNLKSLNIGMQLYLEDNQNIVTPLCQGRSIWRANWVEKTRDYLGQNKKEGNSFLCPSLESQTTWSNYSMPIYNGCSARSDARYAQVPLINVSKPQEAMILADHVGFIHRYDYYSGNRDYVFRHQGGQNRLFLDGHVQYAISDQELPEGGYWWRWAIGKGY